MGQILVRNRGRLTVSQSLLSSASILPGSVEKDRYIDAEGKRSFMFDHVTLVRFEGSFPCSSWRGGDPHMR